MSSPGNPSPPCDAEGYLLDIGQWTPEFANQVASQLGLPLDATHWDIIHAVRSFYAIHQESPNMRLLVKLTRSALGPEIGNSLALARMFTGNPALQACQLAGLPRPANCY